MKRGLLLFMLCLGLVTSGCVLPTLNVAGKTCTADLDCGSEPFRCLDAVCALPGDGGGSGPELVFVGTGGTQPAGRPSSALSVRAPLDGGAVNGVTLTLSSDSEGGVFSTSALGGTWTSTLALSFDSAGTSAPFYFLALAPGAANLRAQADGFSDGLAPVNVSSTVLEDGFETGTVLSSDTPAGAWDSRAPAHSGVGLDATAAAAHRGSEGLRIDDSDASTATGPQAFLYLQLGPLQNLFARFWARVNGTSAQGSISLFQTENAGAAGQPLAELVTEFPSGFLTLNSVDSGGSNRFLTSTTSLTDGGWHLVEIAVTGVGTSEGQRRMWMDGIQLGNPGAAFDWSGPETSVKYVSLGEPWGTNAQSFTGTLDYDDVRLSTVPLASSLNLVLSATNPKTNTCIPLTLGLIDSVNGAAAPAPEDTAITLTQTGAHLGVFASTDCSGTETSAFTLASGTSTAHLSLRASGNGTLLARTADFFPATLGVNAN